MNNFKKYIGLWLILVVVLALVITYSFLDDIKIGDYTIKKAPFKEALLSVNKISDSVAADSVNLKEEGSKKESELDTLPQSLLIIGDSMTWNLALRLAEYAEANGHDIHTVNWDSSNTKIWAQSDTLSHFIKEFDASYVFICLGANEYFLKNADSHKEYVESIIKKVGDIPYTWIGPPNLKGFGAINDVIKNICVPGSFFYSGDLELERRKDKIHPTKEASAIWMDSVVSWVSRSSHPIVMNVPPDTLKINSHAKANITKLKPKR